MPLVCRCLLLRHNRQVEINDKQSPVKLDLFDCELVPRAVIDSLNRAIVARGQAYISVLRELQRARRTKRALEWHLSLSRLELEDSIQVTKDLQLRRVTKDLQRLITDGGWELRNSADQAVMSSQIERLTAKRVPEIERRSTTLSTIERRIRAQHSQNVQLQKTVTHLDALVRERQQIQRLRGRATLDLWRVVCSCSN
jgi:hypothetical protein